MSEGETKIANLTSVCRGEFSDKIVESAKLCTEDDLNKAYAEIEFLRSEIGKLLPVLEQRQMVRAEQVGRENGLFAINVTSAAFGLVGFSSLAGVGMTASVSRSPNPQLRRIGWISLVTTLMASASFYYGVTELKKIEIAFSDIPKLEEYLKILESQFKLRQAMISSMLSIKEINKK